LAAFRDDAAYEVAILLELLGALANRSDLRDDHVREALLAIEAADARRAAPFLHPRLSVGIRIDFVKVPHRTFFRIARVRATNARRIRLHRPEFLRHGIGILSKPDRVAVRLGHLAPRSEEHTSELQSREK